MITWLSAQLDHIAVLMLVVSVLLLNHAQRATTRRVTAVETVVDGLSLDLRERRARTHPSCRAATERDEAR